MKKTLIILVLLLVGISNSSFADKLPTSLFGISILEPIGQLINKGAEEEKYLDLAGPAVNLYGGKILVRVGKVENIEGNKYERIVIIVFDSSDKAKECYKSKEYQQAFSFLKDDVAENYTYC